MKKLFTTLALAGAVVFGANAQRNIDLGFTILSPTEGQEFTNLADGETFEISIQINNNGTDDILTSDFIVMDIYNIYEDASGNSYYGPQEMTDVSIPGGGSVTATLTFTQRGEVGTADGVSVFSYFPSNSKDTFAMMGYAFDASENLIVETDFELGSDGLYMVGDNNIATVSYSFVAGDDEPHSISVASLTSNIEVYPNPAKNEINFAYNFDKASTAVGKVMDLSGKVILTKDFGTQASGMQNFTIPVADLPNGNYTLEFVTENNRGVSKFTVTK